MKIAICGCSGLVGTHLIPLLISKKHFVIPITRSAILPEKKALLVQLLTNCDIVINLAGSPVNKRWSKNYKRQILDSRILTTRAIVNAINDLDKKPKAFLNASATGIYPSNQNCDESCTVYGSDFLARVCQQWESETKSLTQDVRAITLRFGLILDTTAGAFPKLIKPFKLNLGGKIGNGNQGFSWIHIYDAVNAIYFLLNSESASGIYNITSPDSCTNYHFTHKLAALLKCNCFFTVPSFILRFILGEQADIVLKGQFAQPLRLMQEQFHYQYPSLEEALANLLKIRN